MGVCVLVMGLPRSGTSVVSGILHRLGVVMGIELKSEDGKPRFDWPEPDPMNPTGYYADSPLENITYEAWMDTYPPAGALLPSSLSTRMKAELAIRQSRQLPRWGIKCSFTPWVMPEIQATITDEVRVITTRRAFDTSVRSMRHWFNEPEEILQREWLDNCRKQITSVIEYCSHLVVDFDELYDSPRSVIQTIAEYVGSKESQMEAFEFFNPKLRRFR